MLKMCVLQLVSYNMYFEQTQHKTKKNDTNTNTTNSSKKPCVRKVFVKDCNARDGDVWNFLNVNATNTKHLSVIM